MFYSTPGHAIKLYDGNELRQQVLQKFSRILCVDEIHLCRRVVLLASDPVADIPIACDWVSRNDGPRMRRFMQNMKTVVSGQLSCQFLFVRILHARSPTGLSRHTLSTVLSLLPRAMGGLPISLFFGFER